MVTTTAFQSTRHDAAGAGRQTSGGLVAAIDRVAERLKEFTSLSWRVLPPTQRSLDPSQRVATACPHPDRIRAKADWTVTKAEVITLFRRTDDDITVGNCVRDLLTRAPQLGSSGSATPGLAVVG